MEAPPTTVSAAAEPACDESGVDLAQIRAMLELTPAERLQRVFGFMASLLEARRHGTSRSG